MMNERRVILLFVKYPLQGRVKTRLAKTMGAEAAVAIYKRLCERLIQLLRSLEVDEIRVCFDPPAMQQQTEQWLRPIWQKAGEESDEVCGARKEPELVFYPQAAGDLGDRLRAGFTGVFDQNRAAGNLAVRVVAIGSDCIEMDEETFQAAWSALQTEEVVFGPTFDGGYYLLGMNELQRSLLDRIPWSTESTLQVSLQKAKEQNLRVVLLDRKNDIDTEEDWRRAEVLMR
ncbi:MAG: glycosyltransferase [Verrucomicrobiales bacterium]|nr:glycosyltransferase [Verrucomicrobiales bacterium]